MTIEAIYPKIGKRIERERERKGMSQAMLGHSIEPQLTRAAISNMENGSQRVMLHVLIEIAAALRVPLRRLLP